MIDFMSVEYHARYTEPRPLINRFPVYNKMIHFWDTKESADLKYARFPKRRLLSDLVASVKDRSCLNATRHRFMHGYTATPNSGVIYHLKETLDQAITMVVDGLLVYMLNQSIPSWIEILSRDDDVNTYLEYLPMQDTWENSNTLLQIEVTSCLRDNNNMYLSRSLVNIQELFSILFIYALAKSKFRKSRTMKEILFCMLGEGIDWYVKNWWLSYGINNSSQDFEFSEACFCKREDLLDILESDDKKDKATSQKLFGLFNFLIFNNMPFLDSYITSVNHKPGLIELYTDPKTGAFYRNKIVDFDPQIIPRITHYIENKNNYAFIDGADSHIYEKAEMNFVKNIHSSLELLLGMTKEQFIRWEEEGGFDSEHPVSTTNS